MNFGVWTRAGTQAMRASSPSPNCTTTASSQIKSGTFTPSLRHSASFRGDDGIEEFSRRCQELGDTEDASLDLTISVVNSHPDGRATYSLDPTQLKAAIECRDRGEVYFPQANIDRLPGL